jgi:hypothetical protein
MAHDILPAWVTTFVCIQTKIKTYNKYLMKTYIERNFISHYLAM